MKKIAVFIPCYNVARRIRKFLQSFDQETLSKIDTLICVDNASEDSTLKIVKDVKSKSPILKNKLKIFKNKKNYGIGGSHKIVFNYLIENEFDYCLIIPSSYKGSPNEILKLFCTYQHNNPEVDVFFGKRIFKSHLDLNAKIVQRMSRNVAEPLKHLLSDYKFSDIGSRFILIRVEVLKDLAFKSLSDGSEFNLQLNVLLTEVPDLKIREIELKKWAFSNTDSAKILRYSGKMIKTMTHYGVNKYLFQRSGWRLFNDFPDNIEREFEII